MSQRYSRSPGRERGGGRFAAPVRTRLGAAALLSGSAAGTALWALRADRPRPVPLLILAAVSFGGLAAVLLVPALRRSLSTRVVIGLSVATLAVAIVPSPPPGADLWLYAVYGRIVADHGESPYVHPPAEHPEDPWVEDLTLFVDDESRYGPAFVAAAAGVAAVGGDSRLAVRLAHQGGAALAVVAGLVLLVRAGADPARLALLGLNPVVVIEVVSQGRNDAYVGLAFLVAVLLARRRPHLAAVGIAVAALVKLPIAIALGALATWVWWHHGVRRASTVAATGAAVIGLAYLVAGGAAALGPVLDARLDSNDVSLWVLFRDNGFARAFGSLAVELGPISSLQSLAPALAIALAAVAVAPRLRDRSPVLVLALPVVAYFLTSPYPSSWYLAWILPALTLRVRTWIVPGAVALFSVLLLRMHYAAALHVARGDTDLAAFAVPVEDGLLRVLQAIPIPMQAAGIVTLVADSLGLRRRAQRDAPSATGARPDFADDARRRRWAPAGDRAPR